MGDVKFVRINGRVVPIKAKGSEGSSSKRRPAKDPDAVAHKAAVKAHDKVKNSTLKKRSMGNRIYEGALAGVAGGIFGGAVGILGGAGVEAVLKKTRLGKFANTAGTVVAAGSAGLMAGTLARAASKNDKTYDYKKAQSAYYSTYTKTYKKAKTGLK